MNPHTHFATLARYNAWATRRLLDAVAAGHYRAMVAQGFTLRNPIDVMIGAFCIERNYLLLHNDRDFEVMHHLRGLRVWMH